MTKNYLPLTFLLCSLFFIACKRKSPEQIRGEQLYAQYCASCHIAPKIDELPKQIWKESILPDMLSRMKIKEQYEIPNSNDGFRPEIALDDWVFLENYIILLAPDTLDSIHFPKATVQQRFEEIPLALDDAPGSSITYLSAKQDTLFYGTLFGKLDTYLFASKTTDSIHQGTSPITWYNQFKGQDYFTEVGIIDPSEQSAGLLIASSKEQKDTITGSLHRPVHTLIQDFNDDGKPEMVVSEFGDKTGQLSLIQAEEDDYSKKTMLALPGCIRSVAKDMDNDGKIDFIVLSSQGNEGVTIFYQESDMSFRAERVLNFSPVYGSSWFELVDYNGDGHDDIITVNGDNADKSYVHKPYHGMRIHLNDGNNNFTEAFFYPLYGATRGIGRDFDADGDVDFALISSFPNYEQHPKKSLVYLENKNAETFDFDTQILKNHDLGRWFLMDASDLDEDGDLDLIVSSLTYSFAPVPDHLTEKWGNSNVDVLVLLNTLN